MLTDDEIEALSDDPEEAFVQIARTARKKADANIYCDGDRSHTPFIIGFFSAIRAASNAYDMFEFDDMRMPDPGDHDILAQYERFAAQVDEYVLQLQFSRKRNLPRYSVALDEAAKVKIHALLNKIRAEIEAADLDDDKRNALFDKVAKLAEEVDKNRTSFQRTLADLMELAPIGETAGRIVARILGVYRDCKHEEDRVFKSLAPPKAKQLPPPTKPKKPLPRERFNQDLDDEIPF